MAGGPVTIFDKSALQMLNQDEAVWLECYFQTAITPLFYVETLADLEKKEDKGRPGMVIISELALKTPSNIVPNAHHKDLIASELSGYKVQMGSRPIVGGGKPRKTPDGKVGIFFDEFPERAALDRWQKSEFDEIERAVAKDWRQELAQQDHELKVRTLRNIVPSSIRLNNLESIKALADNFCDESSRQHLDLILEIFEVNPNIRPEIIERWELGGKLPIAEFAPYTCHVFKIDLVYYLGINGGFISDMRASNKADMAYLYYLPFTMVFVSGDRLQLRIAPLFMESDHSLVKASDLKAALKEIDEFHNRLPDEVKEKGVYSFASYPPSDMNNLVTQLWDKHMRPDWRDIQRLKEEDEPDDSVPSDEIVADIMKQVNESVPIEDDNLEASSTDDYSNMTTKHMMYVQRGKWRMVSKEVEDSENAKDTLVQDDGDKDD